jgi:RNA recognition motif-containing protein
MNIYVGNLPSDVTEDELRELFEGFGQAESANVVKDVVSDSRYRDIYGCLDD